MPFLSATRLFCLRVAAPAKRGGRDPFDGLRGDGIRGRAPTARYSVSGLRVQKSPQDAGCGMGSGDNILVLAAGLPCPGGRLRKGVCVSGRAGVRVRMRGALLRQFGQ